MAGNVCWTQAFGGRVTDLSQLLLERSAKNQYPPQYPLFNLVVAAIILILISALNRSAKSASFENIKTFFL